MHCRGMGNGGRALLADASCLVFIDRSDWPLPIGGGGDPLRGRIREAEECATALGAHYYHFWPRDPVLAADVAVWRGRVAERGLGAVGSPSAVA